MKGTLRIAIVNRTGCELAVFPLQWRILPGVRIVIGHRFSRPLSIRMAKGEDFNLTPYTAIVSTAYEYELKFKERRRRLEWDVSIKNDEKNLDSPPLEEPKVVCTISSEDGTKNVPPGGEDD